MGIKEFDLRKPVIEFFERKGYICLVECYLCGGFCDIVALKYFERVGRKIPDIKFLLAVELKISNIASVVRQAEKNIYRSNASFIAIPKERFMKLRESSLNRIKNLGLGVITIDGNSVKVKVLPKASKPKLTKRLKKKLWSRVKYGTRRSKKYMKGHRHDI